MPQLFEFLLLTQQCLQKLSLIPPPIALSCKLSHLSTWQTLLRHLTKYYPGFGSRLRLLYSTQPSLAAPFQHVFSPKKQISVIRNHAIVGVFDTKIQGSISKINESNTMDSVYVDRIGYKATTEDQAVILAVTKQGTAGSQLAHILGQEIKKLCTA